MNARQDKEFSRRADAASMALWPGRVLIAGVEYACSLVRTQLEISADDTPAGVRLVAGIRIEIAKQKLPVAPAFDAIVKDIANGRLYLLKSVAGEQASDTSWHLSCAQKSA